MSWSAPIRTAIDKTSRVAPKVIFLSIKQYACRLSDSRQYSYKSNFNSYRTSLAECGMLVISANVLGVAPAALALLTVSFCDLK